jgi:hypothetical protein
MKKALLISLLLVSIFLIGSSVATAFPVCTNYQDYSCTYTGYQYGEIYGTGPDCVELCYDDGFEVDTYSFMYGNWFYGYLYPATGSKNLLGTADTTTEWAGISAELRGKSMTMKFAFIQDGSGYVLIEKCKQCNNCCATY